MKMKIEPRQPLHSRRASKSSPNHNTEILQNGGDLNRNDFSTVKKVALTNAVTTDNDQEHPVNGHAATESSNDAGGASNPIVNDLKDALTKVGDSLPNKGSDALNGLELANLKDLLILNLDLIQHQQQLLIARDRQIKSLTAEKEALKNRLERMDRRMSLLRQKSESETCSPSTAAVTNTDGSEPCVARTPSERGSKRKSEAKIPNETPHKLSRHRQKSNKTPVLCEDIEEPVHSLRSSDPPAQEPAAAKIEPVTPKVLKRTEVKDRIELTRTPNNYYVHVPEHHDPDIVGKVIRGSNRKNKIKVEVPKWRFHPVSNCYQMEGTEVTDDDVYLKRHQRFENDEKRRKRWDMQRMREQTAYQKLVASRTSTSRAERFQDVKPVTSLKPEVSSIRFIEVHESLPVNLFGYAMPKLPDSDFVLKKWPERPSAETKETKTRPRRR